MPRARAEKRKEREKRKRNGGRIEKETRHRQTDMNKEASAINGSAHNPSQLTARGGANYDNLAGSQGALRVAGAAR